MKKILLFVILFLKVSCPNCAGTGAWQDTTGGLTDGEFNCLGGSYDGSDSVYIGTSDGLYRKYQNNTGWRRIFICRGQYKGINHIHVARDNTVYIATRNGLYKSCNFGKTWKRLFRGIGKENHCTYVISNQGNKETIYLGTVKGLFWTEDKGTTWKRTPGILGNSKIDSIAITKTVNDARLFIICDDEIYKALKDFKYYKKVFGSDSLKDLEDDILDAEDNAEDEAIFSLNDITAKSGVLYLTTNRGLFTSRDDGRSWLRFNNAGLTNRRVNHILVSNIDSKLFAATENGVFEYIDQREEWRRIYAGMDSINVKRLMVSQTGGDLWALCNARVYILGLSHSDKSNQKPLNPDRIFSKFENEPTVNETMAMAIEYAEVYPEKIKKWRRRAKLKALFPKVNFGIDHAWSDTYEIYTTSSKSYWVYGPQDRSEGWDLNFSWDLSDLIWNESQTSIDVRSKLMVQLRDNIVDEVTRTYFERRRLQIELFMNPPDNLPSLLKKRLRIQELTAGLDGLTGGRFSKAIKK